ncbi:MAG TPA: hypothetical protein ENJ95_08265 [Bacteroidetes bacterium]|nr:hypothetical protein [Bacteroidota bacterium]
MKKEEKKLVELYLRNGYMRCPNQERQKTDGHKKYKKGYEIRWVAKDKKELERMQRWLKKTKFKAGKPYAKGKATYALPVYGKEAVERLQALLENYDLEKY